MSIVAGTTCLFLRLRVTPGPRTDTCLSRIYCNSKFGLEVFRTYKTRGYYTVVCHSVHEPYVSLFTVSWIGSSGVRPSLMFFAVVSIGTVNDSRTVYGP